MGVQDDFAGTRHDGEDGRVWNHDDRDACRSEWFGKGVAGQIFVVFGSSRTAGMGVVSCEQSVGLDVVVGVCFGMDDGEFAFGCGFEEEALDGQ